MTIDFNNCVKVDTENQARALLEIHAPNHHKLPPTCPCWYTEEDGLRQEYWRGFRSLDGGAWTTFEYVATSPDRKRIHLSEYWGDDKVGIYTKI